jgi:hypothetical protein
MKRLLPVLMGFALLSLSGTGVRSNLLLDVLNPPCPGRITSSPSWSKKWTDYCFGTYTLASGSKYVGEWKDGQRREQFVMANLSIFRQIWYFDIA